MRVRSMSSARPRRQGLARGVPNSSRDTWKASGVMIDFGSVTPTAVELPGDMVLSAPDQARNEYADGHSDQRRAHQSPG